MPQPQTVELCDFGYKIKLFLIATQLRESILPKMSNYNELADFLKVKPARVSEWVQGIPGKRAPHFVPCEQVGKLSEALVLLGANQISLSAARYLWVTAPFLSFNFHLFDRPLSRIEPTLDKTSPSLSLKYEEIQKRRRFVSHGDVEQPEYEHSIMLNKGFYLFTEEALSGWVCLTVANRQTKQLLLPNKNSAIYHLKNEIFRYPQNSPFLQLNMEEVYSFTIIEIRSQVPPPIITPPNPLQELNTLEEQAIANILSDSDVRWGMLNLLGVK